MLKIRLSRLGKKHQSHYRLVVTDSRTKNTGKNIAILGHYHPLTGKFDADQKQAQVWLAKGAQPSARARKLLKIS